MPCSRTEEIWPPPPTGTQDPPTEIAVGSLRIAYDGHRLTLVNKAAHRFLIVQCIVAGNIFLIPLWSILSTHYGRTHYWAALRAEFHHPLWAALMFVPAVLLGAFAWCLYDRGLHRGSMVIDRQTGSVWLGGDVFCLLSELKAVRVSPHGLSIVRSGVKPWPHWKQALAAPMEPGMAMIGRCRTAAQARQVAAVLAGFAGVPVETKWGVPR